MFFTLFFAAFCFAADPRLSGLEEKIDQFIAAYQGVPNTGVAVGVLLDGELVLAKGYGYRDRERNLPVNPETIFAIGSATKSFVSTALAALQEEERVDFGVPIRFYLPDFSLESEEVSARANLHDLLSHQVGLPRHDFLWYMTPFTSDELFHKLPFLEMDGRPGMGFRSGLMQYNNLMYMVAGRVLEKRAGVSSWPEYVSNRFLSPLGMESTGFDLGSFTSANAAIGYEGEKKVSYKSLGGVTAAGSMNSNVLDLSRWVQLHLREGKTPAGQSLVSGEALASLYEKRSDASSADGKVRIGYGLGFMLSQVEARPVIWHGGNIDGFSAHVSFMPKEKIGVVVLVNQSYAANFEYPLLVEEGDKKIPLLPYLIYAHLVTGPAESPKVSPPALARAVAQMDPFYRPAKTTDAGLAVRVAGAGFLPEDGGEFSERAYGKLRLLPGSDESQLEYYGNFFVLRPTGTADEYDMVLKNASGSEAAGLKLQVVRQDGRIIALEIPFEAAVRPIRFVPVLHASDR